MAMLTRKYKRGRLPELRLRTVQSQCIRQTGLASGQGGLQQQQAGQAVTARWSTNVPAMNAPLAIFIRASDQRLIIKSYHAALVAPGGINGIKQVGTVQSSLLSVASEWIFPAIEDVGTSTNVSGAGTIVVSGSLIPMQSAATSAIANCTWQFSKGTAASATPATRMLATNPQAVSAIGSSLPAGSTQSNNSVLRQSGPAAIAANAPANVQTMMAQAARPRRSPVRVTQARAQADWVRQHPRQIRGCPVMRFIRPWERIIDSVRLRKRRPLINTASWHVCSDSDSQGRFTRWC